MKRTTEHERREYVEEYRNSGKSKKEWCREKGIPLTTFFNWLNQNPETKTDRTEEPIQWAEVAPLSTVEDCDIKEARISGWPQPRICMTGGGFEIRMEDGFDAKLLVDVLRVVKRVCC